MDTDIICASLALNVILGFLFLRIEITYHALLDLQDDVETIMDLPDFHDLVYNPRFWLIWTADAWAAWVERNPFEDDGDDDGDGRHPVERH